MNLYSSNPRFTQKIVTVRDAVDKLKAFNAMYESNAATSSVNNCTDWPSQDQANWRNGVRDGVINCGGEATEIDFFEKVFGGKNTSTESSDVYVKYNTAREYNIFAENAVTGGAPGAATQFQIMRSQYGGAGKWSRAAVGGSVFIYEDNQWCQITAVDKTTDYAHLVTIVPYSKKYVANIPAKKKMMFNPTRVVDGYSSMVVASDWDTNGYTLKVQPFRMRIDWELPIQLMRPYKDIMQFAFNFDANGQEVDNFELFETIRARENFKYMKNLIFFMGQQQDNPLLLTGKNDQNYNGFNGYIPSLRYGGGVVYPFDPGVGFGLGDDFQTIILRQDAMKKTNEFICIYALPFMMGLNRRSGQDFKNNAGSCTFETFLRNGMDKSDIVKLGIDSYKYMNYTMHFKKVSALSDERSIGNSKIPFTAMMMPGTGMRDSKGREVPAFEFFTPGGSPETGTYEEYFRDHRKLDLGTEKLSGTIAETYQMVTHCPENHILLDPTYAY